MALPVEDAAGFDHEAGRMNFTCHDTLGMNFHLPLRKDDSVKVAGDDYTVSLDLALHASPFAKDQAVAGHDISVNLSIQAKCARQFQRPFQPDALIQKARPFPLLPGTAL